MKIAPSPRHILLVSSLSDPAGSLIHEEVRRLLQEKTDIAERYTHLQVQERLIYLDGSSFLTDADLILFLSRHASVNPQPVLTVHVTGNYGEAVYGGEPNTLTPAATSLMHALMNNLAKYAPAGYSVSYEATHHGPTNLSKPSCFIEVGSTEIEWHDRGAATAVAQAVLNAVPGDVIHLAGFGGTHYAKRQTEITLTTRGAFGHIMPTRDLGLLTQELFDSIIRCTGAESVYIDKKAVSRDELEKIHRFAGKAELPVIGQTDLQQIGSLCFDHYKKILRKSKEISLDSHIHIHKLIELENPEILSVPSDLIEMALKIDSEHLFSDLDQLPIVHISSNGVACQPQFIGNDTNRLFLQKQIIRSCITILSTYYKNRMTFSDSIDTYLKNESEYFLPDGEIVITEKRFDPSIAESLGVKPGRDFGKLRNGETLIIDEKLITPEMVFTEDVKQINMSLPNISIN